MSRILMLIEQGGPILWVIVVAGLVALGVFIERALHLHRARIKADDFLRGILNILKKKNITEALAICDETPGPVAFLVKTAIQNSGNEKDAVRKAVEDASLAEISRMERRLVVVATVAQLAPLLGLLGTVFGMMETLFFMEQHVPLVQTLDILTGMNKALITTAAGLIVAVPCYAGFNLLVIKIDRIVLDMERAGAEIVTFLEGKGDEALNDQQGQ